MIFINIMIMSVIIVDIFSLQLLLWVLLLLLFIIFFDHYYFD